MLKHSIDQHLKYYDKLRYYAGVHLEHNESSRFTIWSMLYIFCSHLSAVVITTDIFYADDSMENVKPIFGSNSHIFASFNYVQENIFQCPIEHS